MSLVTVGHLTCQSSAITQATPLRSATLGSTGVSIRRGSGPVALKTEVLGSARFKENILDLAGSPIVELVQSLRCIFNGVVAAIPWKFRALPALLAACTCVSATAQNSSQSEFRESVLPFLAKNCLTCHSDKVKTANLSLEHPGSSRSVWEKVLDKVSSGRMPPPGSPSPARAEVPRLIAWIEASLDRPHEPPEPTHVTLRSLNRVESTNTVRDPFSVALRPAGEFPLDDAGYGFHNIGGVLSVSPLLIEKY